MAYISMFFLLGLSPQRRRRRAPVGSIFLSISKNSPTISHFHPPGSGIGSHRLRACSLPAPYLLPTSSVPPRTPYGESSLPVVFCFRASVSLRLWVSKSLSLWVGESATQCLSPSSVFLKSRCKSTTLALRSTNGGENNLQVVVWQ